MEKLPMMVAQVIAGHIDELQLQMDERNQTLMVVNDEDGVCRCPVLHEKPSFTVQAGKRNSAS